MMGDRPATLQDIIDAMVSITLDRLTEAEQLANKLEVEHPEFKVVVDLVRLYIKECREDLDK
jgi:hypothetical protein